MNKHTKIQLRWDYNVAPNKSELKKKMKDQDISYTKMIPIYIKAYKNWKWLFIYESDRKYKWYHLTYRAI